MTDDDHSVTDARATIKQRNRCNGRKESLGKEIGALDPGEHFNVIALMLELPDSCCVCKTCVCGEGVLVTLH